MGYKRVKYAKSHSTGKKEKAALDSLSETDNSIHEGILKLFDHGLPNEIIMEIMKYIVDARISAVDVRMLTSPIEFRRLAATIFGEIDLDSDIAKLAATACLEQSRFVVRAFRRKSGDPRNKFMSTKGLPESPQLFPHFQVLSGFAANVRHVTILSGMHLQDWQCGSIKTRDANAEGMERTLKKTKSFFETVKLHLPNLRTFAFCVELGQVSSGYDVVVFPQTPTRNLVTYQVLSSLPDHCLQIYSILQKVAPAPKVSMKVVDSPRHRLVGVPPLEHFMYGQQPDMRAMSFWTHQWFSKKPSIGWQLISALPGGWAWQWADIVYAMPSAG